MSDLMGYAHPKYALSLREFGEPRELPHCGGWILVRKIPGTSYKDGMGCYPLFICREWTRLHEDLKEIESELVSLVLVTDPFGTADKAYLERYFQIVKPFKKHPIVDLCQNPDHYVKKRHRRKARKSLKDLQVEFCDEPFRCADEWIKLYDNLIMRHNISGIKAFSKNAFLTQMQTPGIILVVGKLGGEVVGGLLVVIQDKVAYAHLTAYSDLGYKHSASYGIFWMTLKYLAEQKVRYLDLGGTAGIKENAQDGLSRFKAGWSNESRIVYLCCRVFNQQKYESVCRQIKIANDDYFPAYRSKKEFGS